MSRAVLVGWRFDHIQEFCFQLKTFRYVLCWTTRGSIWWLTGMTFSGCETFRYGQCRHERNSICWYSGIVFWGLESFIYGLCCLKFADTQESLIQVAKRSNLGSTVMKGLRFAHSKESHFQAAKRSNKSSTILQNGRFADAQESRFQASKRFNMGIAVLLGGWSANVQEFWFRTENVQICAVPNCKGSISGLSGMAYFGWETFW